jgi:tRNA nucleotidyltransferase/poly(A) polymerase
MKTEKTHSHKQITRSQLRRLINEAVAAPVRMPLSIHVPDDLIKLHEMMRYAGKKLYLVGGAVRDALQGKPPKDYDLATDAEPEKVMRILQRDHQLNAKITGEAFGVVRVKTPAGEEYEIATFRRDIGTGRRPDAVEWTDMEEDAQRRDLTINALFYDIGTGEVIDYVGGIDDIRNGVIRAAGGSPADRFSEDKLRMLRAVRFAARMGFTLSDDVVTAIKTDPGLLVGEGAVQGNERITEEFVKGVITAVSPSDYIKTLDSLGLLTQSLPSLSLDTNSATDINDPVIQIALIASNNPRDIIRNSLKKMRYKNSDIATIEFLVEFRMITKESAVSLKKKLNKGQVSIDPSQIQTYGQLAGVPSNVISGFLTFASLPTAIDARELISQGIKPGPEIGIAMDAAEADAYETLIYADGQNDMISEKTIRLYIRRAIKECLEIEADMISEDVKGIARKEPKLANAAKLTLKKWDALRDPDWKGSPEQDPSVRKFMRSMWDNSTSPGWTKAMGLSTDAAPEEEEKGTAKQFSKHPWSAVAISTFQCKAGHEEECPGPIRHSDYWKKAKENRKIFDKEGADAVKGKQVAFDPDEIEGDLTGAIAMNTRTGGTHGDACITPDCDERIGGNVNSADHSGDDLAVRGKSAKAPDPEQYLVRSPRKPGSKKPEYKIHGPMPEAKRLQELAGIKES